MTTFQDMWALLSSAATVMDGLARTVSPTVLAAGMQIWQGLAIIMLVWTGTQMALAGQGLNMAALVRLVIGLSIPLGMLRFYVTPLVGGFTVPDLITGMGAWLQDMIVADTGRVMGEEIFNAFNAFSNRLGEAGFFSPGTGWVSVLTSLPGLLNEMFDLVVTIGLMALLGISMLFVWALGQAQVMWAQIALALTMLLGPVFIPFILVPQLSWLFWGWFRTLLIYSLYGAVSATVFRVMAELGLEVIRAWTGSINDGNVTWTGVSGLTAAGVRTVVTVPYIVGAGLASAKIGELTQLLVLGGGNFGSGAGQAVRAVRMARGA